MAMRARKDFGIPREFPSGHEAVAGTYACAGAPIRPRFTQRRPLAHVNASGAPTAPHAAVMQEAHIRTIFASLGPAR